MIRLWIRSLVRTGLMLAIILCGIGATLAYAGELEDARLFFDQLVQQASNPVIASLAKESLARLEQQTLYPTTVEIPLMPHMAGSLAVPVILGKTTTATFLVDTGATYTVITPKVARQLGLAITAQTPKITILTANGAIHAPKVIIPRLSVGGLVVTHVEAVVQDLGSDALLGGLLGISFFKDKALTIQPDKLILSLRPSR